MQDAINNAPDRAIVVMPDGQPEWDRTLGVSRNIGLMAENPGGVVIKDVKKGHNRWNNPVIGIAESTEFHHQDFEIIGPADEEPVGNAVGITTRHNDVLVTGYNVHMRRFTWSCFSIMDNSRGAYLLDPLGRVLEKKPDHLLNQVRPSPLVQAVEGFRVDDRRFHKSGGV